MPRSASPADGDIVIAGPRGAKRGGVEPGRSRANRQYGLGQRVEGVVARLADRRQLQAAVGLGNAAECEAAAHRLEVFDVLVERGRPDGELGGEAGERHRVYTLRIRDPFGGVEHPLGREAGARHQRLRWRSRKSRMSGAATSGTSAWG